MIDEHRLTQESVAKVSRLKVLVPSIAHFHTSLPLAEAWKRSVSRIALFSLGARTITITMDARYDLKYCVSARRTIPPSFNEVRHTLNLAQSMAVSPKLKLVSFDGDGTIYEV